MEDEVKSVKTLQTHPTEKLTFLELIALGAAAVCVSVLAIFGSVT